MAAALQTIKFTLDFNDGETRQTFCRNLFSITGQNMSFDIQDKTVTLTITKTEAIATKVIQLLDTYMLKAYSLSGRGMVFIQTYQGALSENENDDNKGASTNKITIFTKLGKRLLDITCNLES